MSMRLLAVTSAAVLAAALAAAPAAASVTRSTGAPAVAPVAPAVVQWAACPAVVPAGFATCGAVRVTGPLLTGPLLTGSRVTSSRVTGSQVTGSQVTGSRVTGSQVTGSRAGAVMPAALPAGFGPRDLASAYKLPPSGGAKALVAIVAAYNDPSAAADMAKYRATYGLAACTAATGCFRQVNQSGAASPLPTNDAGWASEESLELDMISAVCPRCHIILVEATSASFANLYAAEDEAVTLGAKYISNGWGAPESSSEVAADVHFNHPGVAITAPSGSAGEPDYPGASRFVTAVGGTTLIRDTTTARGWTETGWGGSGSGCSHFETRPAWQLVASGTCNRRVVSDVSAVADTNTGVAVYQTFGGSGWAVFGGGSVPVPIIAAVYALAGAPTAGTYPASYPYAHPAALFDITAGPDSGCGAPLCKAGPGWDGPTGLGTPNGVAGFAP